MKPYGLIPDEWLVSYAAGALSEPYALMIAAHAGYQPEVQKKIAEAEEIGGQLLADLPPATMQPDALNTALSLLEDAEDEAAHSPVDKTNTDVDLPECLRAYLGHNLDALQWRFMGPGMKQIKLATGPEGEKLWLLRARGGTKMPMHDHKGTEMTLVLRGGYQVADKHYTPGLLELADTDLHDHQPVIDEGEDCICLVVTDAPIRLHSFIGRMVQPFIGL